MRWDRLPCGNAEEKNEENRTMGVAFISCAHERLRLDSIIKKDAFYSLLQIDFERIRQKAFGNAFLANFKLRYDREMTTIPPCFIGSKRIESQYCWTQKAKQKVTINSVRTDVFKIQTLSIMCQHHSNTMVEDEICEQQHRIEQLMLEKDSEHNMLLLRSPSSPRMTMCQIPTQQLLEHSSIEEQGPLAPLPTPSRPIPSQFQRDDKILQWHDCTQQGLSSVYFPPLSVDHADTMILETNHRCNSKKRNVSDLSSLPLPKHIRLLPRRRKRVLERNHIN